MKRKLGVATVASLTTIVLLATAAGAQDAAEVQANLDNIWVFIAGILVFLMQAGFGLVEAGLTRAKNVANIMAKNLADMVVGALAFWAVGYGVAFNGGNILFGTGDFFLEGFGAGDFDVVYCFLSPAPMARLFAKAAAEMKPGSLFVSNSFAVPGQSPGRIVEVDDRRRTKLLIWEF